MTDDTDALVELLRRLAGRIGDGQLRMLRSLLGAQELGELQRSLLFSLRRQGIALTEAEIALLPEARIAPDSRRVKDLPRIDTAPTFRFEPADADGSDAERRLLTEAAARPGLRRILKTRRVSPPAVVYLVVYRPDADVSRLQDALSLPGVLVEVVAEGEHLPPYQAAALAAGRPIRPVNEAN